MKTALLTAMACILVVSSMNNSEAHTHRARQVQSRDFMAISVYRSRPALSQDGVLHGPTGDPMSTATGGPAGGFGS